MEPEEQTGSESGFQLGDLWAIVQMQRRLILGSLAASMFVAIVYSVFAPRYYSATAIVQLAPTAGQEIEVDRVVDDLTASWNRNVFTSTQIGILESRALRALVLERYVALGIDDGLLADDRGIGMLGQATEINARKNTELIDITITTRHPEQAAILANLTVQVFKDQNQSANVDAALDAREWLATQVAEYERRIATASQDLIDYQQLNDMADAEQAVTGLASKMTSLNEAYGQTNTERVMLETVVKNYENMLASGNYDELAKHMNTPLIISLNSLYAEAMTEQARISAVLGERMPERRATDAELERITSGIRTEVENVLSAERKRLRLLREKERDLEGELDAGKVEMLGVQGLREDYEKKRLELENAKAFYERLRERMGEIELQSKTQLNRVRKIEDARTPSSASYPIIPLNLGIGFLVGLVLGLGGALLREWFDDSVSSPIDVQTYLKVPFLGIVPKISDSADETTLATHTYEHSRSPAAEALRNIRTVLELNPLGEIPKRILITSAVSSEGKTSTVVGLAIAFVNLNKRVLMIDCDLRRPRLHKVFTGEREPGLASVLTGEKTLAECIRETAVPNLFYLSSGRADRPNEILASPAFPELLQRLGEQFDLVMIDSPPSVLLSDARLLSRYVDGVIIVVREHVTSRVLVREAVLGLEQVGARTLGVVINAVDLNRHRTGYKYHYGYAYRYDRYYDDGERNPTPG